MIGIFTGTHQEYLDYLNENPDMQDTFNVLKKEDLYGKTITRFVKYGTYYDNPDYKGIMNQANFMRDDNKGRRDL